MFARDIVYWGVDVQVDFMLPEGKLYVPGAERILPNINRLVDRARQDRVFLISSADAHHPDDPELRDWPPHCLKGTRGAQLLPEACAEPRFVVPNQNGFSLPENVLKNRQITIEKNTLNVFDNPGTDVVLERWDHPAAAGREADSGALFVVFGVATEYCVRLTVEGLLNRGRRVAIVTDAVRAIDEEKGKEILNAFHLRGAQLITANRALSLERW